MNANYYSNLKWMKCKVRIPFDTHNAHDDILCILDDELDEMKFCHIVCTYNPLDFMMQKDCNMLAMDEYQNKKSTNVEL